MTKYEEFAYNKRLKEFFDKVYNHKAIAFLYRRDYTLTEIFIENQAICISINSEENPRCLVNISNEEIDYMAHLYASYQLKELQYFLEDACRYASDYLSKNYSIEGIDPHKKRCVFYNESTIEQFKTYKK